LSEALNRIVACLPPPANRAKRHHAWIPSVLLGLCLLPALQSSGMTKSYDAGSKRPTQIVVEALHRSVARAAAPTREMAAQVPATPLLAMGKMMLPAAQFQFWGAAGDRNRAVDCLATAAWYEAGNDVESQRSVIQVILNRVAHPSFPKSVCGVVFEGSQRKTGCQFTFTCDGSMTRRRPSPAALARATAVAELALSGGIYAPVMQATHYHADYVLPWWSGKLVRIAKVGQHIFYGWPGKRGVLSGRPGSAGEGDLFQLVSESHSEPLSPPKVDAITRTDLTATAALVSIAPASASSANHTPAPRPDNVIFLTIDRVTPSGRWAVSALGKCAKKAGCSVLGYESDEQITRNSALPPIAREKPVFLFVRDAGSGIELALWDCEKVERPASNQCLPNAGQELANLLRDRQS
jgi:spore germination cell wall hydrolase CwlJ-like protein